MDVLALPSSVKYMITGAGLCRPCHDAIVDTDAAGPIPITCATIVGVITIRTIASTTEPVEPAAWPSGDQLAAELHHLGVRHLSFGKGTPTICLPPERFLIALAESPEPRLRAALVPLLLWHPEFAAAARSAAAQLSGRALVTWMCTYSAAVALQRRHGQRLAQLVGDGPPLPDLFAADLDLPPSEDADVRLIATAERHAQLSGEAINWRGTYVHAVAACLRFAEPITAWNP